MRKHWIPTLTLSMSLGVVACGGNTPSEEDAIDEASAYLEVAEGGSEEEDDPAVDISADMGDADADAIAEESTEPDPSEADAAEPCDFAGFRRRALAHYDTDGDGVLSPAERREIREDFADANRDRPRLLRLAKKVRRHAWHAVRWAFDENGDRVLDEAERAELIGALQARCEVRRARVLAEFDANGNGTLEPEERQAFRQARRERLAAKLAEILAAYDANGNGVLDPAERVAWRVDLRTKLHQRRAEVKAMFDANSDGVLDAAERAALKEAVQEAIATGTPLRRLLS